MNFHLDRAQKVPCDLDTVFAFFGDAANLERLTPGFLRFRFLTPLPIEMRAGALIDYRIALFGVPMRWRTRIEIFEPQRRFVDVQLEGPYRRWVHTHEFHAIPGGTLVTDAVEYELPLGPLGWIAHEAMVRRTLDRIFDYRRSRVAELLGEWRD